LLMCANVDVVAIGILLGLLGRWAVYRRLGFRFRSGGNRLSHNR